MKRRAVQLMRRPENVAAVRRLADELLERETIPGDEIAWLIDLADGTTSEHVYRLYRASKPGPSVRD